MKMKNGFKKKFIALVMAASLVGTYGISSAVFADDTVAESTKTVYTTSVDGVTYTYDFDGSVFYVHVAIADGIDGNVTLPLGEMAHGTLNAYAEPHGYSSYPVMPGDYNEIVFDITTADGVNKEYKYVDGSFNVSTLNLSGESNLSGLTGFDGQNLPWNYIASLTSNSAVKSLFGFDSYDNLSIVDACQLYNKLESKGFTGDSALSDYFLSYYNNKYGANWSSLEEMFTSNASAMKECLAGNVAKFTVTAASLKKYQEKYPEAMAKAVITEGSNGKYTVQFRYTEQTLAGATYEFFYRNLFEMSIGDEFTASDFSSFINKSATADQALEYGVGQYMNTGSQLYTSANTYFNNLGTLGTEEGSVDALTVRMLLGVNGPYTGNAYQVYSLGVNATITLADVTPVEEPSEDPGNNDTPADDPTDTPVVEENGEDPENNNAEVITEENGEDPEDNDAEATEEKEESKPETGDTQEIALYAGMLFVTVMGLGTIAIRRKQKSNNK